MSHSEALTHENTFMAWVFNAAAVHVVCCRDPNRRVNFLGFCHSVDLLQEAVEETVTSRGGEVLEQQRQLRSGLSEALRLTVVIPYL
jgi:hypothetical protein